MDYVEVETKKVKIRYLNSGHESYSSSDLSLYTQLDHWSADPNYPALEGTRWIDDSSMHMLNIANLHMQGATPPISAC